MNTIRQQIRKLGAIVASGFEPDALKSWENAAGQVTVYSESIPDFQLKSSTTISTRPNQPTLRSAIASLINKSTTQAPVAFVSSIAVMPDNYAQPMSFLEESAIERMFSITMESGKCPLCIILPFNALSHLGLGVSDETRLGANEEWLQAIRRWTMTKVRAGRSFLNPSWGPAVSEVQPTHQIAPESAEEPKEGPLPAKPKRKYKKRKNG